MRGIPVKVAVCGYLKICRVYSNSNEMLEVFVCFGVLKFSLGGQVQF